MLTWMEIDDLVDCVSQNIPKANRSNVYSTLRAFGINRVPQEQKEQAKTFKEYKPGFLHIDVTYLPKIDGVKYYLFVAIDRLQGYFTIRFTRIKQQIMPSCF